MSTPFPFAQPPSLPPLLPSPGYAGFIAFKLAFQLSPIILTSGIATNLGGALPIIALTEGANFVQSLLTGGVNNDLDGFFASYQAAPGSSLVNQQVSMYPMANQTVAANAVIAQPLNISMIMMCPAGNASGGYPLKLVTMTALQNSLTQHNLTGGLYTIITPCFIYTNCVMTGMRDVSGGQGKQVQDVWQLDFVQPLVTVQSAQTALNGLMSKLANGTAPQGGTPSWSVAGLAVNNPVSLLTSSLVPSTVIQ
jgi:hypothetical protein